MLNHYKFLIIGSALLVVIAASGCGKKKESPPVPPAGTASATAETPAPTPESALQPVQAPAPLPAQVPPPANPTVIPATANAEAALGELTQAVRRYSAERQRVPATLSEVVAAGYVRNPPQPPAGKRFAIDTKRVAVILQ